MPVPTAESTEPGREWKKPHPRPEKRQLGERLPPTGWKPEQEVPEGHPTSVWSLQSQAQEKQRLLPEQRVLPGWEPQQSRLEQQTEWAKEELPLSPIPDCEPAVLLPRKSSPAKPPVLPLPQPAHSSVPEKPQQVLARASALPQALAEEWELKQPEGQWEKAMLFRFPTSLMEKLPARSNQK